MRIRSRLKRATLSFLRELSATEVAIPQDKGIVPVTFQEPEPSVVIDNKLMAGKNVLITGTGRNIGSSIAHEMAKQGANIFFADIDEERCKNVENELKQKDANVRGFNIDCSDTTNVRYEFTGPRLSHQTYCTNNGRKQNLWIHYFYYFYPSMDSYWNV